MQCPAIAHVAIEGFMEHRDAFLEGYSQPDLNQRSSGHAFFVVPQLPQRAFLAIQIGVGHIVDHPGILQPVALFDRLKDRALQLLPIALEEIHGPQKPVLGELLQVQHHCRSVRANHVRI